MRRIVFSVLMSVFFTLSIIPLPAAARGPSNRAAGNVKRVRIGEPDMEWTLKFNAHEAEDNLPATGLAIAEKINGDDFWGAEVSCVKVANEYEVYLGGRVVAGNVNFVGQYIILKMFDGGQPGVGVDIVFSDIRETINEFEDFCRNPELTPINAEWDVIDGNLQVFYTE
jgi:hypothetical protein